MLCLLSLGRLFGVKSCWEVLMEACMTWIQPDSMHNVEKQLCGRTPACIFFFITGTTEEFLRLAISKGFPNCLKEESRECYTVNRHSGATDVAFYTDGNTVSTLYCQYCQWL